VSPSPPVLGSPVANPRNAGIIGLWTAGSVSFLASGTFAVLSAIQASSATSQRNRLLMMGGCPPAGTPNMSSACLGLRSALLNRADFGDVALVALATGNVFSIAGLVMYLKPTRPARQTSVRVIPIVTGRGGGLLVDATF
jgi:hypothetical protein